MKPYVREIGQLIMDCRVKPGNDERGFSDMATLPDRLYR